MDTQILAEYLEYLELERGLAKNTIDAYRRDLIMFAQMKCAKLIRQLQ